MERQKDKIPPWLYAVIAFSSLLAIWLLTVVAVVIMEEMEWREYPLILQRLWIPIVSTLVLTLLVSFVAAMYGERLILTTLVVVGAVFILVSIKDTNFREIVFPVIDKSLDVDLLVAGITLLAFALALGTITRRYNSKKESSEPKITTNFGTTRQRPR
ncbi:unnamed protein product, partial [marine sediment metagenome]